MRDWQMTTPMGSISGLSKAGPPTMAGHIVVLFTNSGTPVGRACITEDADSTLGPKECQVPEGHPGGSI